MSENNPLRCPRCDTPLATRGADGTSARCSNCGSVLHFKHLAGEITPTGHLFRRARSPGKANYMVQREEGESFFRKTGHWHRLTRVIDRIRKWYYEHIEDTETGAVIRHKDESLTEHHRQANSLDSNGRDQ